MSRRVVASTLAGVTFGSLLHFAWEWSGRSPVVAIFAATNESTWEHLKMAFWPALALAPLQRHLYGRPPGWLAATAVRCLLPPLLIVLLFYGYVALLGRNALPLDIAVFVVSVAAGETVGHARMFRNTRPSVERLAAATLLLFALAFGLFSFRPPPGFLFVDPSTRPRHPAGTAEARSAPAQISEPTPVVPAETETHRGRDTRSSRRTAGPSLRSG